MTQRKLETHPDNELFDDWVKWIDRVEKELVGIAWNRRLFREVSRVFRHNSHLREVGGFLYDWMLLNYTAGVAMAFRREVDRANAMGFVHLLGEIAARPEVLSRRRHHAQWPLRSSFEEDLRRQSFEAMPFVSRTDDPLDDHIDPSAVLEDIKRIRDDTELAHNYVEQTIAHRAWGEPRSITFHQFNAAVNTLTPIFKRYYARLTNTSLVQVLPVRQFNGHLPFTFPWDVTCERLWDECRGERTLPWAEIKAEYRDDPIGEDE